MTQSSLLRTPVVSTLMVIVLFSFLATLCPRTGLTWDAHYLITRATLGPITSELDQWKKIKVRPLAKALRIIFKDKKMTRKKFLALYQLNPETQFPFGRMRKGKRVDTYPKPGQYTSAQKILSHYPDEPDWGMDRELNISPDQRYTGGYTGPTSQGFRHLFFRKWRFTEPIVTFHFPPNELGEAPMQVHRWFELSAKALKAGELYWGFRFLAWSIHYLQDLCQPFHTNQLVTLDYLYKKSLIKGFDKLVKDTTQVIANYHWLYESYVTYLLYRQKLASVLISGPTLTRTVPLHLALHAARESSRLADRLGKNCKSFFGKSFKDPKVDVANNIGKYPPHQFDEKAKPRLKKEIIEITQQSFKLVGGSTRNLVLLALSEIKKK